VQWWAGRFQRDCNPKPSETIRLGYCDGAVMFSKTDWPDFRVDLLDIKWGLKIDRALPKGHSSRSSARNCVQQHT
jgi:hypothetical protein